MGDFALNCAWDDYGADPTMVDLFRWHGSEEVEHRSVAHDVAVYFHDSYVDRVRAMMMAVVAIFVFFQRTSWFLVKSDPTTDMAGGRSTGCGCATRSSGYFPNTASCSARIRRCTSGRASHRRRWVQRRRRWPTWPAPPRPAPRTFDGRCSTATAGRRQASPAVGATTSCSASPIPRLSALWAISGAIRKVKTPRRAGPRHHAAGRRPSGGGTRPGCGGADDGGRRRPTAAAVASRRTSRPAPAQRQATAVLAVRRPRRHRHISDRGAPDRRRRRRVDRGARGVARRRPR